MGNTVTFDDVRKSDEIRTLIQQADKSLDAIGYTEHSFAHVMRCAEVASDILLQFGYTERDAELAKIAGYMHDVGNLVNRMNHAQTGAVIAFQFLHEMGMDPTETAQIVTAIGYHDETSAFPVNAIAAALILADKTDVRRSRVRDSKTISSDIHDRVNYAVTKSELVWDSALQTITLVLDVDTGICSVTDYFEIFLGRMQLCKTAAKFFGCKFKLNINGLELM